MSVKFNLTHLTQWASLTALVAVGASAVAADPATVERDRAEVVAETLAARTQHALAPAGEHVVPAAATQQTSSRTRAEVVSEVASARAAGQLLPAGEAPEFTVASGVRNGATTTVASRSAVKASVIAARAAGELVPAGEGPYLDQVASAKRKSPAHLAAVTGTTATAAGQ